MIKDMIISYSVSILRDAEVKRDEFVKDAGKLVTRATAYKDEAKREQKKVQNITNIENSISQGNFVILMSHGTNFNSQISPRFLAIFPMSLFS